MTIQNSGLQGATSSTASDYSPWNPYGDTTIVRNGDGSAYAFQLDAFAVDADGAPNAYHPDDVGKGSSPNGVYKGLDNPSNAGYPKDKKNWPGVIVADPDDKTTGYLQPVTSACPGFFVAQTSLSDHTKSVLDTHRYVDATQVPYFVFPGKFLAWVGTGGMGDFGVAKSLTSGAIVPFIVADVGQPSAPLGEMSIALAAALGGTNPNARTGKGTPPGKVVFILFPRSAMSPAWPVLPADLTSIAMQRLQAAGGFDALDGVQL